MLKQQLTLDSFFVTFLWTFWAKFTNINLPLMKLYPLCNFQLTF
ncbi:unnamed protein product [Paramecium octaurelia]|uniref:Uncharacterized protein n=1 Tax=Paramecium octaurelia TaxID=43137 RepID=A0A8S1XMN8_PAROT|nr:unnamed protein product [Paramecium octaurelia]